MNNQPMEPVKQEALIQKSAPEYAVLEESFADWLIIKEPTNQTLIKKLNALLIKI